MNKEEVYKLIKKQNKVMKHLGDITRRIEKEMGKKVKSPEFFNKTITTLYNKYTKRDLSDEDVKNFFSELVEVKNLNMYDSILLTKCIIGKGKLSNVLELVSKPIIKKLARIL